MKSLLLAFIMVCSFKLPAQMPPPALPPRTLYFAVTDVDTNQAESGFSNEYVWSNGVPSPLILTWTPPMNGVVDHYNLYSGFQSGVYTRACALPGTSTSQAWPVPGPPPVWQKTFTWLESTNLPIWKTNSLTLCTITGAPPGNVDLTRSGPIRWQRIACTN